MLVVINAHTWWDHMFFQGSDVISALEHARERWGMMSACFFDANVLFSYLCIFAVYTNVY